MNMSYDCLLTIRLAREYRPRVLPLCRYDGNKISEDKLIKRFTIFIYFTVQ